MFIIESEEKITVDGLVQDQKIVANFDFSESEDVIHSTLNIKNEEGDVIFDTTYDTPVSEVSALYEANFTPGPYGCPSDIWWFIFNGKVKEIVGNVELIEINK